MKRMSTIILVLCLTLLTGCWDQLELEERGYVIAIGIDPRVEGNMSITFQVANPQVGSTDIASSEKEPASVIITLSAPDMVSSLELANTSISRSLTFTHAKALIIGEDMARSDKFLSIIEYISRDREIKKDIDIIISKEKASEFIRNNKSDLETRPHKHYELMTQRWATTGLVPFSTYRRYLQRIVGNSGVFLATYATTKEEHPNPNGKEDNYIAGQVDKQGGNPVQMIGSAVLKEGYMIGSMTGEETRAVLILRPQIRTSSYLATYPDPLAPEQHITARVLKMVNNKYTMNLENDTPQIHVTVPIGIELLGIPSGIDYVLNTKNQNILKNSIQVYLENAVDKLVKRTQKEFKGDPFLWCNIARKQFGTVQEWDDYNWMEKYPKAEVEVTFNVEIVDFGRQLQPFNQTKMKD